MIDIEELIASNRQLVEESGVVLAEVLEQRQCFFRQVDELCKSVQSPFYGRDASIPGETKQETLRPTDFGAHTQSGTQDKMQKLVPAHIETYRPSDISSALADFKAQNQLLHRAVDELCETVCSPYYGRDAKIEGEEQGLIPAFYGTCTPRSQNPRQHLDLVTQLEEGDEAKAL